MNLPKEIKLLNNFIWLINILNMCNMQDAGGWETESLTPVGAYIFKLGFQTGVGTGKEDL